MEVFTRMVIWTPLHRPKRLAPPHRPGRRRHRALQAGERTHESSHFMRLGECGEKTLGRGLWMFKGFFENNDFVNLVYNYRFHGVFRWVPFTPKRKFFSLKTQASAVLGTPEGCPSPPSSHAQAHRPCENGGRRGVRCSAGWGAYDVRFVGLDMSGLS